VKAEGGEAAGRSEESARADPAETAGGARRGFTADRGLLLALAGVSAGLFAATPWMIRPYPHSAPWYESAAMFPRAALALAAVAALAEVVVRRHAVEIGDSDELDSSAMRVSTGLLLLALFIAYALAVPLLGYLTSTFVFLCACGRVLRLPWRRTLLVAVPLALTLWGTFAVALKVAFGHGWLV
jgi:hypothetical protein